MISYQSPGGPGRADSSRSPALENTESLFHVANYENVQGIDNIMQNISQMSKGRAQLAR